MKNRSLGVLAVIACSAGNLLPIWLPTWPAMQDGIGWVEMLDIVARYADASTLYQQVYQLSWRPDPNTLSIAIAHILGGWCSGLTVMKLCASLYAVGTPLALLALCNAFDRSPWLALLGCPMVFGAPFSLGLLNFLLAIPLIIAALATARRSATDDALRWQLLLTAILLLTWFAHAFAWLIAVGLSLLIFAVGARTWSARLRSWPVAVAAPLFAAWAWRKFVRMEATVDGMKFATEAGLGFYFSRDHTIYERFWNDSGALLANSLADEVVWVTLGGLWLAALALGGRSETQDNAKRDDKILGVVAAASLLAWWVLPIGMHNLHVIGERVLLVALLIAAMLPPWRSVALPPRPWCAVALVVALTWPAFVAAQSVRFEASEMAGVQDLIAELPQQSKLTRIERQVHNNTFWHGTTWYLPRATTPEQRDGTSDGNGYAVPAL